MTDCLALKIESVDFSWKTVPAILSDTQFICTRNHLWANTELGPLFFTLRNIHLKEEKNSNSSCLKNAGLCTPYNNIKLLLGLTLLCCQSRASGKYNGIPQIILLMFVIVFLIFRTLKLNLRHLIQPQVTIGQTKEE